MTEKQRSNVGVSPLESNANSSSDSIEPVELLADDFMRRQRSGEKPTIDEYCEKHPELADEIREVFPALVVIERVAPATADLDASDRSFTSPDAKPIESIGDYRVLREIGRGGMGVVYEAEQESLGRRVALKVLPRHIAKDEKALLRFQREARAAAKMHHTNIVPVFDVGHDKEYSFYAMQLIKGQGLDQVIGDLRDLRSLHMESDKKDGEADLAVNAREHDRSLAQSLMTGHFDCGNFRESDSTRQALNQPASGDPALIETIVAAGGSTVSAVLPGDGEVSTAEDNRRDYFHSVAEIGLQSARALAYAHARGITHRDIKPSNLILDTGGVVWITDFGLARTGDSTMTQTGDILGTIRYMSPERFKGQCDNRADVYSLGLTLYEMLVLKPAFESPDRMQLIDIVNKTEIAAPRSIDSRVPRDLETIVLKACNKDPRRRYQSADDMADDLQRFVNDEPVLARRASPTERVARWSRRNPWLATAMSVSAAALIAITGISIAAAQTQGTLNDQLTDANEELNERTQQQRRTNQALADSNQSKEELIRELEHSQSRLAEKQAEFVAEKGDLAESMLWLARSYELSDTTDTAKRQSLLSRLTATADRMPRLIDESTFPKWQLPDRSERDNSSNSEASRQQSLLNGIFRSAVGTRLAGQMPVAQHQSLRLIPTAVSTTDDGKKFSYVVRDVLSGTVESKVIHTNAIVRLCAIDGQYKRFATFVRESIGDTTQAQNGEAQTETRQRDTLTVWSMENGSVIFRSQWEPDTTFNTGSHAFHFDEDGNLFAFMPKQKQSKNDCEVQRIELPAGKVTHVRGVGYGTRSVRFSADGRRLILMSMAAPTPVSNPYQVNRHTVRCLDIESGEFVGESIRCDRGVPLVTAADGSHLAVVRGIGNDRKIEVINFESGKQVGKTVELKVPVGTEVELLNTSPDGTQLIVGLREKERLAIWDPKGNAPNAEFDRRGRSSSVRIFDVSTGLPVTPPLPTRAGLTDATMSTDGRNLAVTDTRGIRRWRLPGPKLNRTLIPNLGARMLRPPVIRTMLSQPQAFRNLSSASSFSILQTASATLAVDEQERIVFARPDEYGVSITVWDRNSGQMVSERRLPGTEEDIVSCISPTGRFVLTAGLRVADEVAPEKEDETDTVDQIMIRCWNTQSGKMLDEPVLLETGEIPLAISPDGQWIVLRRNESRSRATLNENSATAETNARRRRRQPGIIRLWNRITKKSRDPSEGGHSFLAERATISADGQTMIASPLPGSIARFDLSESTIRVRNVDILMFRQQMSGRLPSTARAQAPLALSANGTLVAEAVEPKIVQVRSLTTGQVIGTLMIHPADVTGIAFDPSGSCLVTSSVDGMVRQWQLADNWIGQPVDILERVTRHTGLIFGDKDEVIDHESDDAVPIAAASTAEPDRQSTASLLERDAVRFLSEKRWEDALVALKQLSDTSSTDWNTTVLQLRPLIELGRFHEADKVWTILRNKTDSRTLHSWLTVNFQQSSGLYDANPFNNRNRPTPTPRVNHFTPERAPMVHWYQQRLADLAATDEERAQCLFDLAKALEVELHLDRAAEAINKAVSLNNDSADIHYYRAHLMERLNRWEEALASREAVLRLIPDHLESPYRFVTSLLFAGNDEAFQRSWSKYLSANNQRLESETAELGLGNRIAKPRLLAGGAHDAGFQRALEIADANFNDMGTSPLQDWVRLGKGLAEYRRGKPDNLRTAIEVLDSAFDGFQSSRSFQRGEAITRFVAAMAHHRLGQDEIAEATYLDGVDRHHRDADILRRSAVTVWNDWQQAEVARREAESLLGIDEGTINRPVPDTSDWIVLLSEEFDDGISGEWERLTGQWSVVDGAACGILSMPDNGFEGYARLERSIEELPDTFEIEYETWTSAPMLAACFMRLPSGAPSPIGHRVALCSAPDRDLVKQNRPGKGLSLLTYPGWNSTDLWFPQANPDFHVKPEQHYNVRIIRQPQRITVFIDGEQVMSNRVRDIETKSLRFFARGGEGTKMFIDNVRLRIPAVGANDEE